MIRSTFGTSRYTVHPENDVVLGTVRTWNREQPTGLVYCHGSGGSATTAASSTAERTLLDLLARDATVIAPDLGLQAWGNDTAVTRIGESIAYLRSVWGVEGRVVLVAGSMGFSGAAAYALARPENVAALAGVIPLTNLADIRTRGAAADVDAAYGGAYDDAVHGPDHSPVRFAPRLPADLPVHLWTSPNDPLTVPATADAFVAARPQTGRTILPPLGHSEAAVIAAAPLIAEWVRAL